MQKQLLRLPYSHCRGICGRRGRKKTPYGVQKTASAAAVVIQLQFHALQEDENAQDMGIENPSVAGLFGDTLTELGEAELYELVESGRDGIFGLRFVDEPAAKGFVGLNEAFQGFAGILIDQAIEALGAFGNRPGGNEHEGLMITQEGFLDDDLRMRDLFGSQFPQALVIPAEIQEFAIKRAGDGLLAFLTTALRADVLAQGGAKAFRPPGLADHAFLGHQF